MDIPCCRRRSENSRVELAVAGVIAGNAFVRAVAKGINDRRARAPIDPPLSNRRAIDRDIRFAVTAGYLRPVKTTVFILPGETGMLSTNNCVRNFGVIPLRYRVTVFPVPGVPIDSGFERAPKAARSCS